MNYDEFKRQVNKAGLRLNQFAELIDIHAPSISTYSGKEVPTKYAVLAVLLAEIVDRKLMNLAEVLAHSGIGWPPSKDEKVTRLDDYRGRPKA